MSTNRRWAWKGATGVLILLAALVCAERSRARTALQRALDAGLARVEQRIAAAYSRGITER